MANLGNVDDGAELTLASATAAIITARWNNPGQRRRPEPEPALPTRASARVSDGGTSHTNGGSHGHDSIFAAAPFEPVPEIFGGNGGSRFEQNGGREAARFAPEPAYEPPPYEPTPFDPAPDSFAGFAPVRGPESRSFEGQPYDPPPFESSSFEAPPFDGPAYEPPAYEPPAYEAPAYEPRSDGFAAVRSFDPPPGLESDGGGGFQPVPRGREPEPGPTQRSGGFADVPGGSPLSPVSPPFAAVESPPLPSRPLASVPLPPPPPPMPVPVPVMTPLAVPPPLMPPSAAAAPAPPEVARSVAPPLPPAPPPLPLRLEPPTSAVDPAPVPPAPPAPPGAPARASAPISARASAPMSAPASAPVPAQRSGEPRSPADFGFAGSVMADLEFPEPFEVEPFEPGWINAAGEAPSARTGTAVAPRRATLPDVDPLEVDTEAMLPQRVPGVPDVPEVPLRPNDPLLDPTATPLADGAELSRIATFLRDDTVTEPEERPDGFDLAAVLAAVQGVPGVRDANLRWNSGSGHTLRIEFDDSADEGLVTRQVARLLRETMGLAAAPNPAPGTLGGAMAPDSGGRRIGAVGSASVPAQPGLPSADPDQRGARPMPAPAGAGAGPRVVLDHVQVTTLGVDATVEVRLVVSGGSGLGQAQAVGRVQGPAVDAYLLRLAAGAAGDALDQLLVDPRGQGQRGRCFVEHVAVVPFAGVDVAVVVLLLVWGSYAEQHSGSAIVAGDPRQAVVRATLSAVNRRLQSLLA